MYLPILILCLLFTCTVQKKRKPSARNEKNLSVSSAKLPDFFIQPKYAEISRAWPGDNEPGLAGLYIAQPDTGRFGLIDINDNIIIPFEYSTLRAADPKKKIFFGRKGSKNILLNLSENRNIELKYDIFTSDFREGLALFSQNGKYGFIDQEGNIVIDAKYENKFSFFSEGLASVSQNGKSGYIDRTGKVIVPFIYDTAFPFREGIAEVQLKREKSNVSMQEFQSNLWLSFNSAGFIDRKGKVVIPIEHEGSDFNGFREGRIILMRNKKWGAVDAENRTKVPFIYDSIETFSSNGEAVAIKNGKMGLIDKDGKIVLPFNYTKQYEIKYWDKIIRIKDNNSLDGYMDFTGKVLIPKGTYSFRGSGFVDKTAVVSKDNTDFLINTQGEIIAKVELPEEYSKSFRGYSWSSNGYCWVTVNDKKGIISKTGKLIVPIIFEDNGVGTKDSAIVKYRGKWGVVKVPES